MGRQKRKHVRLKSNIKLFVSGIDGSSNRSDDNARIVNFSEKGLCFESKINFNIDEQCVLEFYLLNQKFPIKANGTIVWKMRNAYLSTYGISLVKVRVLDKYLLKKTISHYCRQSIYGDLSLLFWELIFLSLLMYLLVKLCVLLPLAFTLSLITLILFSFYIWIAIYASTR